MNKNNILLVSGYFPYPATHGGKVDVWNRIIGINKLGFKIDLIVTETSEIPQNDLLEVKKIVNNVFVVKRKNKIKHLFFKKPLQVLSRNSLINLEINKSYDYLVLEGDYVGEVIYNKTIKYNNLIVRSQNDESNYFLNLSMSTKNIFKKFYFYLESIKFKSYSNQLYKRADRIWFISKDEEIAYQNSNKVWLPAPFSISEFKSQTLESKTILFVGSLFMPNNLEGLFWYLNNVHNKLCEKYTDYNLIIAGSTNGINKEFLVKKFNQYQKIEFYFDVPDLSNLYKEASIFINPMFHGAGVKVKSINAIINGLPLVSTSKGVEGIGLINNKSFILSDTAIDFIEKISDLINDKISKRELVIFGQNYLRENHYLNILQKELK